MKDILRAYLFIPINDIIAEYTKLSEEEKLSHVLVDIVNPQKCLRFNTHYNDLWRVPQWIKIRASPNNPMSKYIIQFGSDYGRQYEYTFEVNFLDLLPNHLIKCSNLDYNEILQNCLCEYKRDVSLWMLDV